MLRVALRARAADISSGCRPTTRQWVEQPKRRSCQLSRPARSSAEAKKGDGISVDVEYSGLWGQIVTFPKRRPFATNIIVATVKTSLADLIVQKGEGKKEIDWKRNGVFTVFGFAYLGVCQWFIYVSLFTRLCPNAIRFSNLTWAEKLKDRAGQVDLVKQTCLDNFIHYTFVYYPVFYTFKELIQADAAPTGGTKSESSSPVSTLSTTFSRAMGKYQTNCVTDNLYMWSLWVPGDLLVYACPIWMRLPLNHAISLAWTMILSNLRGSEK